MTVGPYHNRQFDYIAHGSRQRCRKILAQQFLILLFKILARIHLFRSCNIRMSHIFRHSLQPPLHVGFKPID